MCKYVINVEEKAVIKTTTGELVRPSCFHDLNLYYTYLISTGEEKAAGTLLKKVFQGEKVISNMIKNMQEAHLTIKG